MVVVCICGGGGGLWVSVLVLVGFLVQGLVRRCVVFLASGRALAFFF